MILVQEEKWTDFLPEGKKLFPMHWKELGLFRKEIPMGLDEAKYAALESAGILLLLTARTSAKLIGYYTWFVMPHPHYSTAGAMGLTDMYYVLPEFRHGTGLKLFIESEKSLRKRGVIKAITSCKVHQDHSQLFEKLGWMLTDLTFCKYLGGIECL